MAVVPIKYFDELGFGVHELLSFCAKVTEGIIIALISRSKNINLILIAVVFDFEWNVS